MCKQRLDVRMSFKQFIILLFIFKVVHCFPNGGHHHHSHGDHDEHNHGHDHAHDHNHGHGHAHDPDCGEELDFSDLIKGLGIKVLGKDQESADDISPAEDHNQLNVKALISELFSPSTAPPPVTTTQRFRTSTHNLPIKSHWEGWLVSPVDLVMNNHILEPVYDQDASVTTQNPLYLTETQYYLERDEGDQQKFGPPPQFFHRNSKELPDVSNHLNIEDLNKKPVIPVLDTRWANYHLVNNGTKKLRKAEDNPTTQVASPITKSTSKPLFFKKQKENERLLESLRFLVPPLIQDSAQTDKLLGFNSPQEKDRFQQNFGKGSSSRGDATDDLTGLINEVFNESALERVQNSASVNEFSHTRQKVIGTSVNHPQLHNNQQAETDRSVSQQQVSQIQQQIHNNAVKQHKDNRRQQQLVSNQNKPAQQFRNHQHSQKQQLSQVQQQIHSNAVKQQQQQNILQRNRKAGRKQQQQQHPSKSSPTVRKKQGVQARDPKLLPGNQQGGFRIKNQVKTQKKNRSGPQKKKQGAEQANKSSHSSQSKGSSRQGDLNGRKGGNISISKQQFRSKERNSRAEENIFNQQDDVLIHFLGRSEKTHSFDCKGKGPGLYADVNSNCKRFLMCHENGRMGSFRCPSGTLFNQSTQICDWKKRVKCSSD